MKKIWIVALATMFLLGSAALAIAAESPTPEAKQKEPKQQERGKKREDARPLKQNKQSRDFRLIYSDGVGLKRDGSTVEIRMQNGIITAVTAEAITLKSPGNYVKTYKIDGDTKVVGKGQAQAVGDLKVGEMAKIQAVKVNGQYVAKLIKGVGEPGPKLKELLNKP